MKSKITLFVMVTVLLLALTACQDKSQKETNAELKDEGNGILTYLDVENSPLDGGLSITVDKNDGFINFQITDKEGNDTVEYFKFTPADETCERHKYVSMMGTGFYYDYDYKESKLVTIKDMDDKDVTASSKEKGRFDKAQTETKELVDKLITYYNDSFGVAINDAIK